MQSKSTPYHYHVQTGFEEFWAKRGCQNSKILLIFGLGFDPRCVAALRAASRILSHAQSLHTLCLRFKNSQDENLEENTQGTYECLEDIDSITGALSGAAYWHDQLEVNLFDHTGGYEGHRRLVADVFSELNLQFSDFTDVIVDISAFPRSLMYGLLSRLREELKPNQNLFAVLSEVSCGVDIQEWGYSDPHYIISPSSRAGIGYFPTPTIWIPILGGSTTRLENIYRFLSSKGAGSVKNHAMEVFPIVPFPTRDPRLGDQIVLRARKLFDEWGVPFSNIMYACGDVPFDIYRKIHDVVERYRSFMNTNEMVVSALSGRSLSLGVLLAAWQHNLPVCQIQPKTYKLISPNRAVLREAALKASVTLFWLSGEVYQ